MAFTAIALGVGSMVKVLIQAEPLLASLSYIVAIAAGGVTLFYKFKNKK